MNRKDLQSLSAVRLKEARALFKLGLPNGAYYLAGYAVECALKACVARKTLRHDFPDRGRVNDSYTHSLKKLVDVADLTKARQAHERADNAFLLNWQIAADWSEESRYRLFSLQQAEKLLVAVSDRNHGVIAWIRRYW